MPRDTSPIDQRWIQHYCDEFVRVAGLLPEGALKQVSLRRVECVLDLVEAWQKRDELRCQTCGRETTGFNGGGPLCIDCAVIKAAKAPPVP